MKIRIGVDIDGVMYKWGKTVLYMLRDVLPDSPYGKNGPLGDESQIDNWDYIEQNVEPEHWKWLWTEGVRLGMFRYGHLYSGTIQAVRRLADIGDVVVITHRPEHAVNDTLAWLAYQNLPIKGVHLLTGQEPKSSVNPQCDIYIDDKPDNCEDLAKNTQAHTVALMDRPWNQGGVRFDAHEEHAPIYRAIDWNDFIELAHKTSAHKNGWGSSRARV